MPASSLVTDGKTLKVLRKKRGLTQEGLAQAMQLEVRTIQRWEAGDVKPSIQNLHQLNERLRKIDWSHHPLHQLILDQDGAIAVLDGFAIYQKVNEGFRALYRQFDNCEVEGEYAGDLFQFWHNSIEQITGLDPRALVASNITSIDLCLVESIRGKDIPLRHQVFVVRQKQFSTMLVHEISLVAESECADSGPVIQRRTAR